MRIVTGPKVVIHHAKIVRAQYPEPVILESYINLTLDAVTGKITQHRRVG